MKTAALTVLATLLAFTSAQEGGEFSFNHELVCETTEASPYTHHVTEMINNMRDADPGTGGICIVGTDSCTPTQQAWSGSGGAGFMLCSDTAGGGRFKCSGDPGGPAQVGARSPMEATYAAVWFTELQQECINEDGRIGGKVVFTDGSGELRLFSLPG